MVPHFATESQAESLRFQMRSIWGFTLILRIISLYFLLRQLKRKQRNLPDWIQAPKGGGDYWQNKNWHIWCSLSVTLGLIHTGLSLPPIEIEALCLLFSATADVCGQPIQVNGSAFCFYTLTHTVIFARPVHRHGCKSSASGFVHPSMSLHTLHGNIEELWQRPHQMVRWVCPIFFYVYLSQSCLNTLTIDWLTVSAWSLFQASTVLYLNISIMSPLRLLFSNCTY